MWKKTHSQFYPNVSAKAAWEHMSNINQWPSWHDDLESCKLEGPFVVGAHFMLKPKGGPSFKISITAIEKGKSFTDCTHFFGAKMFDTHRIETKDDGIILHNDLYVTGPLKWFWIFLVAKDVAKSIPEQMDTLAQMAKK